MGDTSKKKSRSEDDDPNLSTKDDSGFVKTFPQRLMELLSREDTSESIAWMPKGDAFVIKNQNSFVEKILPRFFKKTKFTSFKGKLYRWGFRRVMKGENAGAYFHKLFLRDDKQLCLHMRRQIKGKAGNANKTPEKSVVIANSTPISKSTISLESITPPVPVLSKSVQITPTPDSSNSQITPLPVSSETHFQVPVPQHVSSSEIPSNFAYSYNKQSSQMLMPPPLSHPLLQEQVTRALIEEGEQLVKEDDSRKNHLMHAMTQTQPEITEAIMSQNVNRLSKFDFSSSDIEKRSNMSPQTPLNLLAFHKQMLGIDPSVNLSDLLMSCQNVSSGMQYQANVPAPFMPNSFSPTNRFSPIDVNKNQEFADFYSNLPAHSLSPIQENLFDWCVGIGSDEPKLDLLSNAALSFRTPFMQEMRVEVSDNLMQDKDDSSNGDIPIIVEISPNKEIHAGSFSGQVV